MSEISIAVEPLEIIQADQVTTTVLAFSDAEEIQDNCGQPKRSSEFQISQQLTYAAQETGGCLFGLGATGTEKCRLIQQELVQQSRRRGQVLMQQVQVQVQGSVRQSPELVDLGSVGLVRIDCQDRIGSQLINAKRRIVDRLYRQALITSRGLVQVLQQYGQ